MTTASVTVPQLGDRLPELSHRLTTLDIAVGAAGSRDWLPQHYDHRVAVEQIGLADILINTPAIAAWFERLVTDWTGPLGRIGRIRLQLRRSIISGETIRLTGEVIGVHTDETGCCWVEIDAGMHVGDECRVQATVRVAVPGADGDNPWSRRGRRWRP